MEIETPEMSNVREDNTDAREGKRTKWQPPPSHQNLISSPAANKKLTLMHNKPSPRNEYTNNMKSDKFSGTATMTKLGAGDVGIEDAHITTYTENNFVKTAVDHDSLEEIVKVLTAPRIYRSDTMARAEICPKIHRARLMSTKGIAAKIREQYGYEICNTTFLYAEEALYLLETGKLDLYLGRLSLSIERARALLLHSKSHPEINSSTKIKSCSIEEYMVYKHLSQLGYRLRRRDKNSNIKLGCYLIPTSPDRISTTSDNDMEMKIDDEDEGTMMDLDQVESEDRMGYDFINTDCSTKVPSISSPSSGIGNSAIDYVNKRGVKRKFGEVCGGQSAGSTTPTSSAKDISDNEDADEELDFVPPFGDVCMDATPTNQGIMHQSGGVYTVTEADSDVEIVDEIMQGDVQIEEIGHGYDGDVEYDAGISKEPQPSTSAACFQSHGVVDLADSDSDTEEDVKSYCKVWSKFVPNATIQIGFPPSVLLPNNVPFRRTIYEFDMKSKEKHRSDSDLEYYVDELNLSSSPGESDIEKKSSSRMYRTWREWRQGTLNEAKVLLNESLLAQCHSSLGSSDNAMRKLHLWELTEPEKKPNNSEEWRCFDIPFDLYHPSAGSNKHKLRSDVQPCYAVAVVMNDDKVPSFAACSPLIDGVPVLVALVSDESGILFMNPDRSPIPSLF